MRKLSKTVLILLLGFQYLSAQDIFYGPKVGVNINQMMFSGNDTDLLKDMSGMKIASHIGGFVEYFFTDAIAVQPELLYTIKGASFKDATDEEYTSAYVLKYISIPVMAKYYVSKSFSVEIGPYASYLLSAKNVEVNGIFSSALGSEAAAIDLKDSFKPFEFGAALGFTYVTKKGIYLGARYEYGILDIAKPLEDVDASFRNATIMASVGFSLNY